MSKKDHRVVVSLTDATHKLSNNIKEAPAEHEIKILDKTTMLLRVNSIIEGTKAPCYQQLTFDAVGYEDERHVRFELNDLLVQMFRRHRHGCLLRLSPRRIHNVKLLTRLLVSDVDQILLKLPYRLEAINLEYYDVRKFDMINMLKLTQRNKHGKRKMLTTREMFHWLHNEYSFLRSRGTGDDYINAEFVIRDGLQEQHRLHLAFFNVFDCTDRTDITSFFASMPLGKQCKSTLLTDCIKESFDSERSTYTLVVCEMPLDKECARDVYKFMQLANKACMKTAISSHIKEYPGIAGSDSSLPSKSSANGSMLSLNGPLRQSFHCQPTHLCKDDYGKLACWYQRIDAKFSEVKLAMERHYNVVYRQKFMKMCKQLNTFRPAGDKSGGDAHRVMFKNSARDIAATANYTEGLKQFRQLEKEALRSGFACTLSPYMSTKNYELINAEKELQAREIANLREQRGRI